MAKLNKTEINAIVNKLYRELYNKNKELTERKLNNFEPTNKYNELESLCLKMYEYKEKYQELYDKLSNEFNKLGACIWTSDSIDYVLDRLKKVIINNSIPDIPSKEILTDDLTIAAIDSDFDVNMFINNYVNKYE